MRTIPEKQWSKVGDILRFGEENAITLKKLAKRLKCSRDAAYRRVLLWDEMSADSANWPLRTTYKREGKRGQKSLAFYL